MALASDSVRGSIYVHENIKLCNKGKCHRFTRDQIYKAARWCAWVSTCKTSDQKVSMKSRKIYSWWAWNRLSLPLETCLKFSLAYCLWEGAGPPVNALLIWSYVQGSWKLDTNSTAQGQWLLIFLKFGKWHKYNPIY